MNRDALSPLPARRVRPRRDDRIGADHRRVQQHARNRGTDQMRGRRHLHQQY